MMRIYWTIVFLCLIALTSQPTAVARSPKKVPPSVSGSSLTPREIFRRSAGEFSGDIFLLTQRFNFLLEERDFDAKNFLTSHFAGKGEVPPHPLTMHGYAWDYDLHIPMVFWEPQPKRLRSGSYKQIAIQQDVAPTLAKILGIAPPARAGGRVLSEILQSATASKPKAILVFVQDQVGEVYLRSHPRRHPFIDRMMREGANFSNASVSHVDVETSVGHAAVATGAFPPAHLIGANSQFHPGLWRQIPAMTGLQGDGTIREGYPGNFMAPTLSDVWSRVTKNRAKIFSLAAAGRAAVAMGGHGALFKDSGKPAIVWLDESGAKGKAGAYVSDDEYFSLPESAKNRTAFDKLDAFLADASPAWKSQPLKRTDGTNNLSFIRASPAATAVESQIVLDSLKELQVGADDVTDLVWVNMKSTDYCGHMFGFESDECGDVLEATDKAVEQIVSSVRETTGGEMVVVFTADHGCAPLPELSGGLRYPRSRILKDLNNRFDLSDDGVDVAQTITSSQLYLNRQELLRHGHKVQDVVKFLKNYEVSFEAPFNTRADYWRGKGKAAKQKFFADVIAREDL